MRNDRSIAVFTAIDGTLLDARTFDSGSNGAFIRRLVRRGIPVVPVSVMTLDELEPLAHELALGPVMIIEAGGAIARRSGRSWTVEPCGVDAETLLEAVREIEERSGVDLLVYSALPQSDASRVSGRRGEMLQRSTQRVFSEPFLIASGTLDDVRSAAASIGFSVKQGRRFLYLCRASDEGHAFLRVRSELGCETAIGVGGSVIDAEFLRLCEMALLMPGPDGVPDPRLVSAVPAAMIAAGPAPDGWSDAVNAALNATRVSAARR